MSGTASAVLAMSAHHARLGQAHVVGASCAAGRGPSRAIGWRVSAVCLAVCRYVQSVGMRESATAECAERSWARPTSQQQRQKREPDTARTTGGDRGRVSATRLLLAYYYCRRLVCYSLQCTPSTVTFRNPHFGTIGTTTEVGYWGVGVHDFDLSPDCSAFALQLGEIGEWLPGVHIHWETSD